MAVLIVIALVLVAVLLLSVGVIFRSDHRFHAEDVGANAEMRRRGIYCTKTQDRLARRSNERTPKSRQS